MEHNTNQNNLNFVVDSNGVLIKYNGISKDVVIPIGVEAIGDWAFNDCHLNSLSIPEGVKTIGEWAFRANNLKTIIFPKTLKSVQKGAFYNNELTEIFFQSEVELICKWAFYNNKLGKVNFVGEITDIDPRAFDNMSQISFVEKLRNYSTNLLNNDSSLHESSEFLDELKQEKILEWQGNSKIKYKIDSNHILYDYEGDDIDIIIPKGVKEIGEWAFTNCNLKTVSIPEGVIRINQWAFQQNNIEQVIFPKSLEYIEKGAFYQNNIKKIILPDNIRKIEESAFSENDIEEVVFDGEMNTIDLKAFDNVDKIIFTNKTKSEFLSSYLNQYIQMPEFDDPNLTIILKQILTEKGLPLTLESVKKIEELDISSQNITTIKGIDIFENLQYLKANNNQLRDLSPLKQLNKLISVEANINEIESVDVLVNCKKLLKISVKDNPIKKWPDFTNFYNNSVEETKFRGFEIMFKTNHEEEDDDKYTTKLEGRKKRNKEIVPFSKKIKMVRASQTSEELYQFLDDPSISVKITIAESKLIDERIFNHLTKMNNPIINRFLLKNKKISQELRGKILHKSVHDANNTKEEGLKNPEKDQKKMQDLSKLEEKHQNNFNALTREQKIALAQSTNVEVFDELAKDQNVGVRLALAANEFVATEILKQLVNDHYHVVSDQATKNLYKREYNKKEMSQELKNDSVEIEPQQVQQILKSLTKEQKINLANSTENQYFEALSHDSSIGVRFALVKNSHVPQNIIEFLAKDHIQLISERAREVLDEKHNRKGTIVFDAESIVSHNEQTIVSKSEFDIFDNFDDLYEPVELLDIDDL